MSESVERAEAALRRYVPKGMTAYVFGAPVADLSREGLIGALGYLLQEKEEQEARKKVVLPAPSVSKPDGILRTFRRR